jgi:curved DNA-binding protein CbpA
MTEPNHYETLKVKPNATLAEIKQAYRVLVKLFHPDTNSQTTNNDKIIQINHAYEILGDPQRVKHTIANLIKIMTSEKRAVTLLIVNPNK